MEVEVDKGGERRGGKGKGLETAGVGVLFWPRETGVSPSRDFFLSRSSAWAGVEVVVYKGMKQEK